MRVVRLIAIVFSFLVVALTSGAATHEYKANTQKRLIIPLSSLGVNRVMVEKDRILKVVGNDDDYAIEGEMLKGYIFITPKVSSGEMLPITLLTEKGLIQDITFKVSDKQSPVSVLIKAVQGSNATSKASASSIDNDKVVQAISDIGSGNTRQYSLRIKNIKEYKHLPFVVSKVSEYKNRIFKITKIEFTEKGLMKLSELERFFMNAIAIGERGNSIIVVEKL